MCTVTLIPIPGGVRLVTNRDESRGRPPAEPPEVRIICDGVRAIYPLDPQEGGTWVAVTDRGLIFTLLNANPTTSQSTHSSSANQESAGAATHGARVRVSKALYSRGSIILRLTEAGDIDHAVGIARELDLDLYSPFRLLIADTQSVQVAAWTPQGLEWSRQSVAPMCLASSGLGDERVLPRLVLFQQWLKTHGATHAAQDAFHSHVWPDRPEISVMMSRVDARTVSITTVELRAGATGLEATMMYRDDAVERRVEFAGLRPAAAGSA